ncbi:30S ribosomal protein S17 [endosymbiont of Pachyrhynchus infernalis]|uniref:30S ribosomal protein S17 n=1 Tax=endosymbiont of Pachyrhynchus infernalis TaxID=1971488 RepID=UPI000DC7339A|nr:30S ribosomal protein S17 [endosymbiont of Pachyrhynchus infernalis]BBA84841.1 30S ribosomal protein S17 [endosymbiont of Pachyrhynchus infernalis]
MNNSNKKGIIGKVISDRMNKSIIVKVEKKVKHKLYKKYINKITKFYVHDELNSCKINDFVLIKESRPISKMKSWIFIKKISINNPIK